MYNMLLNKNNFTLTCLLSFVFTILSKNAIFMRFFCNITAQVASVEQFLIECRK